MAEKDWYEGIEKEISSLKEKMPKGDYSAYELDALLRVAKRVASLSDGCEVCAESSGKITDAIEGIADWPDASKEQKDGYTHAFRITVKHLEKNHALETARTLGCGGWSGVIGASIATLIGLFTLSNPSMAWFSLVIFPLAWGGFFAGFWKPLIGGTLLVITGLMTMLGYPIIAVNAPGVEQEPMLLIPVAALAGIALLVSGYSFATSPKGRSTKEKSSDTWECEECGAEIAEIDKVCPKCGVEFEGESE